MKYLVANWKMNLPQKGVRDYCAALTSTSDPGVRTVLAPPFPFLVETRDESVRLRLHVDIGAQNCSEHADGAHTGEVSPEMLAGAGCTFVIVGHSERRAHEGETDPRVNRKAAAAAMRGLIPIICVGEDQSVRESGETRGKIHQQVEAAWSEALDAAPEVLVAYEPLWAIGTGVHATPDLIAEAGSWISEAIEQSWGGKASTKTKIIYGGSVSPENAAELSEVGNVSGFLVGGASLEAEKLLKIHKAMAPRH
ncbi:MAG TPA: triose-phosphate isomerase [Thermoanaerobaculia bacterium]|nr:triose-phosphate isomerase [Thermoanaerobaculia bacterium]